MKLPERNMPSLTPGATRYVSAKTGTDQSAPCSRCRQRSRGIGAGAGSIRLVTKIEIRTEIIGSCLRAVSQGIMRNGGDGVKTTRRCREPFIVKDHTPHTNAASFFVIIAQSRPSVLKLS